MKKRRIKHTSSYLMFKQGFKGVLKFKIQFIVIIVMSIIATLISGVAFSVKERTENNFNSVINNNNKFDSVYERKVRVPNGSEADNGFPLMSDFLPDQYVAIYGTEDQSLDPQNIMFNINLSSFIGDNSYRETFVTRAFERKDFKNAFSEYWSNAENITRVTKFNYDANKATYDFNPINKVNESFAYNQSLDSLNSADKVFLQKSIGILRQEFIKDIELSKNGTKLNNSLFKNLLDNGSIMANDISKDPYDVVNKVKPESWKPNNLFINEYIENAFSSLVFQMNLKAQDYFYTFYYLVKKDMGNNFNVNEFVKEFNNYDVSKILDIEGNHKISDYAGFQLGLNQQIGSIVDKGEFLYSYIFGKSMNGSSNEIEKRFLVDKNNKQWTQIITPSSEKNVLNSTIDLLIKGNRGSIVQWTRSNNDTKMFDTNDDSTDLNFKISEKPNFLLKILKTREYISEVGKIWQLSNIGNYEFTNLNEGTLYFLRNQLIGEAAGLDTEFRMELLTIDNTTESKYRTIIMTNDVVNKVHLFRGRMPKNATEILINPEYGYATGKKVGDYITVGGGNFIISGFAAEPTSYYPLVDTDMPLTNNKKGGIVYAFPNVADKITDNSFTIYTTHVYKTYLKNKVEIKPDISLDTKMNLYHAFSNYSYKSMDKNAKYIALSAAEQNKNSVPKEIGSTKSFAQSNERLNWNLFPQVIKAYTITSLVISVLLLLLVVISMMIAIRKTIKLNSNQIGILKAMGAKSTMISTAYISYSVIIMVFIIPLVWLSTGFLHEGMASYVLNYFGGSRWEFYLSWKVFLTLEFVLGFIPMIISYVTALIITSQPTLKILENKEKVKRSRLIDLIKNKMFKKAKFTTRFSLELASVGRSKTFALVSILFITGFMIFGIIAVPSVVFNFVKSYYKSVEYSNEVNYLSPIGNIPTGRSQLSPTKSPEFYEKSTYDSENFFGSSIDLVANENNDIAPINDNSTLPKFIYKGLDSNGKAKYSWLYDEMSSSYLEDKDKAVTFDNDNENVITESNLLSNLATMFGSNFIHSLSKSFQISEVLKIQEYFIHNKMYSATGNKVEDEKKVQNLKDNLSGLLSAFDKGIPEILSTIMKGMPEGENWKERVISAILGAAPAYLKEFIYKSKMRSNLYSFGYSFTNYDINQDVPYTKTTMSAKNSNERKTLIGLPNFQTAFLTNNSHWEITNETADEINQLFNGADKYINEDIVDTATGIKIFDHTNGTLKIPAALNNQAKLMNKDLYRAFTGNQTQIQRLSISGVDAPSDAWAYDDADYLASEGLSIKSDGSNRWLKVGDMDLSKVGILPQYNYKNKETKVMEDFTKEDNKVTGRVPNGYAFAQIITDEKGNMSSQIRPYYSYENIDLFIPKSLASGIQKLTASNGNASRSDTWINSNVPSSSVPSYIKKSWGKRKPSFKTEDYVVVKPYSFKYDKGYKIPENINGKWEGDFGISNLTNKIYDFWEDVMGNGSEVFQVATNGYDPTIESINDKSNKKLIKTIKLSDESHINSYGESVIVIDQNISNLLNGYSTSKYIPYNYSVNKKNPVGSYKTTFGDVKTYDYYTPNELIARKNINDQVYDGDLQINRLYNNWYSGMYQKSEEATLVTTQSSFTRSTRVANDKIQYHINSYDSVLEAQGIIFLSQSKGLITQISTLVIGLATIVIAIFIIVASLLIVIVSDLYINQYRKFMIIMKSLGYSNWKIIKYVLGTATIFSMIAVVGSSLVSLLVIKLIIMKIQSLGTAMPFGLTWWSPFLSTLIIVGSYVASIAISTKKIRNESPATLF